MAHTNLIILYFQVLFLDHPHKMIRDTQRFPPFRALFKGAKPSLKKLTAQVLKVPIQEGEHSSVSHRLFFYRNCKVGWENLSDLTGHYTGYFQ